MTINEPALERYDFELAYVNELGTETMYAEDLVIPLQATAVPASSGTVLVWGLFMLGCAGACRRWAARRPTGGSR